MGHNKISFDRKRKKYKEIVLKEKKQNENSQAIGYKLCYIETMTEKQLSSFNFHCTEKCFVRLSNPFGKFSSKCVILVH